ncbi:Chaperone protein DnaJ [Cytospora mali]|uniref:Chaperone protein DnaJ n=1 Tax=Cytospora mali TaxID=578113 RepID=A0A194WD05_CYTMA|nr:Chaperone protein DnaJ [Valsa mali]
MPLRITLPFRAAAPLHVPGGLAVQHNKHKHKHKHNGPVFSPFPFPSSSSSSSSSSFHSTPPRRDDIDNKTHYEILQLQTNAQPSDIKKSFYALSKAHHPDHNQHDPAASKRFMRISEAYSVLSSAERRARYDRDVLRLHDQRTAHPHGHGHGHHRGSYSSTGPAGGRPASGLSRRRGTFHGPPPSFYRNGGWGAHHAKRSQAHEESTSGSGDVRSQQQQQQQQQQQGNNTSFSGNGFSGGFGGGMGPGQDPLGKGSAAGASDIPHFDRAARAAHTRTQARNDERRARRMAREYHFPSASDWGETGSFFAVLGVLGFAIGVPYLVVRGWNSATANKERQKKDWNRTVTG